jgi:hypothetical protein
MTIGVPQEGSTSAGITYLEEGLIDGAGTLPVGVAQVAEEAQLEGKVEGDPVSHDDASMRKVGSGYTECTFSVPFDFRT